MKRKSGQILILILLIVVVALAVGLSVASRNITNLRTSTQAEHSQRALSAAEGGVEDVLARLTVIAADPNVTTAAGANVKVDVGGIEADVTVKANNVYESVIEPGEIGQVDLKGASGTIQIEWAKGQIEKDNPASIEITLLNKDAGGVYSQTRKAYTGGHADEAGSWETPGSSPDYAKSATIDVRINPATDPILLRIKPFWARTTVRVSCDVGSVCNLPTQTYEVVSEAQTEIGVTRKIRVTRTALPQLPAAFDYVLYSENAITK